MKRMLSQTLIDKLAEFIEGQGDAWVSQMKELISYDEEEGVVHIGEVAPAGLYLDDIQHFMNQDFDSFFPELTNQAGKSVVVNEDETGFDYLNLANLFVHKMEAPTSQNLTEAQREQIISGVFMEGTFLGLKNPIFFPAVQTTYNYYGLVIGLDAQNQTIFEIYLIEVASDQINHRNVSMFINTSGEIELPFLTSIKGKYIPNYPSDTGTFTLKCVNGVLTWVQDV